MAQDLCDMSPIGIVHTPYTDTAEMPIQSVGGSDIEGTVEIFEEYALGLKDLGGFSHIILIYHFHRSEGYDILVKPFLDTEVRGLFSTRAPRRPNPIGISVVELLGIEGNVMRIKGLDMLEGTPLLDIKPYVPDFDRREVHRIGWLEGKADRAREIRSDERFS